MRHNSFSFIFFSLLPLFSRLRIRSQVLFENLYLRTHIRRIRRSVFVACLLSIHCALIYVVRIWLLPNISQCERNVYKVLSLHVLFLLLLNPLFPLLYSSGSKYAHKPFCVFADKAIHVFDFNLFYVRMPKEKNENERQREEQRWLEAVPFKHTKHSELEAMPCSLSFFGNVSQCTAKLK